MPTDRLVGRLYCHEVLERLSDYLDDDLPVESRADVEEHQAGCDVCERFGGRFTAAIRALRRAVPVEDPLPEDLRRQLGL